MARAHNTLGLPYNEETPAEHICRQGSESRPTDSVIAVPGSTCSDFFALPNITDFGRHEPQQAHVRGFLRARIHRIVSILISPAFFCSRTHHGIITTCNDFFEHQASRRSEKTFLLFFPCFPEPCFGEENRRISRHVAFDLTTGLVRVREALRESILSCFSTSHG